LALQQLLYKVIVQLKLVLIDSLPLQKCTFHPDKVLTAV